MIGPTPEGARVARLIMGLCGLTAMAIVAFILGKLV